jgi:hypothetical protein
VLVFDQLSGLNSNRFAHTAKTPTINSRVLTPMMLFAKIRLPRDGFAGGGVQVLAGGGEPGSVVVSGAGLVSVGELTTSLTDPPPAEPGPSPSWASPARSAASSLTLIGLVLSKAGASSQKDEIRRRGHK